MTMNSKASIPDEECENREVTEWSVPVICKKLNNTNPESIKKLTIRTESGMCAYNRIYKDKMTISKDVLSYECVPEAEDSVYKPVKWSYRSSSGDYKEWFEEAMKIYCSCMDKAEVPVIFDVGYISFAILYCDGSRDSIRFPFYGDDFLKLMDHINKMIPPSETVPVMIKRFYNEC